jgi:hypothetical protein
LRAPPEEGVFMYLKVYDEFSKKKKRGLEKIKRINRHPGRAFRKGFVCIELENGNVVYGDWKRIQKLLVPDEEVE